MVSAPWGCLLVQEKELPWKADMAANNRVVFGTLRRFQTPSCYVALLERLCATPTAPAVTASRPVTSGKCADLLTKDLPWQATERPC